MVEIKDRDNSNIREHLQDIQGVPKQLADLTTVVKVALCEISCLKTK